MVIYSAREILFFSFEALMKCIVCGVFLLVLAAAFHSSGAGRPAASAGLLFVANQFDHTANLVDVATKKPVAKVGVDINGHEVVVSPNGKLGYVPIY